MTDYGHDLLFGTFLTPRSARPQDVVRLALETERSGLDLVTFQDHPYQPEFLDTWTLLSYVAAATDRVRLSGDVLDLPSRPPAVLARAAASLDLLSGGRVELGLGAGRFWDAIAGMGGPRRTPAEAVRAVSEAIDVIRGVWQAPSPEVLDLDGTIYALHGARRGPAPAHPIALWIGAMGPRMLRLIGEKADGWLPGLPWMTLADLDAGNLIIDEAAGAADRDPREVRRLVNVAGTFATTTGGFLQGPPAQWVEDLVPLVIDRGVSAFVLMEDDPAAIRRWGAEVAPAVRESVARTRSLLRPT